MNTGLSSQLDRFNRSISEKMYFSDIQGISSMELCPSHRIYQRKEALYSAGEYFYGLYQLRSGSAKASVCSKIGNEHVTEFFYPGDIIGIDGFDTYRHSQNIRFLETSSVICIKESSIGCLMQSSETFRQGLLKTMSHCLKCEQNMLLNLSHCSSEQRVAQFLLDLSQRFNARGYAPDQFNLSMTRTDISSYLGMAIETLSRTLAVFQQAKIIDVNHRWIKINNASALTKKAEADLNSAMVGNPSKYHA